MSLETNQTEVKTLKIYGKMAIVPVSVRFVRILDWKPFMDLFLIRDGETLVLCDEKVFKSIELSEKTNIYKIKLTGSDDRKGHFNYRILIPHEVRDSLGLTNNTYLELMIQDNNRIVIRKYGSN